jgi:hypothetical protein
MARRGESSWGNQDCSYCQKAWRNNIRRVSQGCISHEDTLHRRVSHGVHFTGMCFMGLYLMSVHVIYESSLRAEPGWRESLYRHQGCLEAFDCGRLGRQAAGRPWSALRVVKSCRKTAQRPRCCSKLKQQLCIQNGTRAYYLNYLQ